jgi:hypothetical protein
MIATFSALRFGIVAMQKLCCSMPYLDGIAAIATSFFINHVMEKVVLH